VNGFGAADYAMRIWVDPDRLARLGLTFGDLYAAVQKQNAVNPAGEVGFRLSFSVLLGTPAAIAGAFLGLLVARLEFNVYGQIGLIMLIGLSAKNAILIVELAKVERERGVPLLDAALAAARLRLRPILMTAFAFILGCLPLLDASGAGSVSRRMLGIVVVCGMLAATLLGVFLTPALFVLVEKLGGRKPHPSAAPLVAEPAHAEAHAAE